MSRLPGEIRSSGSLTSSGGLPLFGLPLLD
jgi:hypothetical protein